jgi:hypothetical protein
LGFPVSRFAFPVGIQVFQTAKEGTGNRLYKASGMIHQGYLGFEEGITWSFPLALWASNKSSKKRGTGNGKRFSTKLIKNITLWILDCLFKLF